MATVYYSAHPIPPAAAPHARHSQFQAPESRHTSLPPRIRRLGGGRAGGRPAARRPRPRRETPARFMPAPAGNTLGSCRSKRNSPAGSSPRLRGTPRPIRPAGLTVHPRACGEHFAVACEQNPMPVHPRACGEHWPSGSECPTAPVHPRACGEHWYCRDDIVFKSVHPRACGEHSSCKQLLGLTFHNVKERTGVPVSFRWAFTRGPAPRPPGGKQPTLDRRSRPQYAD